MSEIDLPDEVMIEAGQDFFALMWAEASEEAGASFSGMKIEDLYPEQDEDKILNLVKPHVVDLAKCWEMNVSDMFILMEIDEEDWADALNAVLNGCRGTGRSLIDDYDENIEIAEAKLGRKIDPSPFNSEFIEFADLAREAVENGD
jgi:hypothetical protein